MLGPEIFGCIYTSNEKQLKKEEKNMIFCNKFLKRFMAQFFVLFLKRAQIETIYSRLEGQLH